MDSSDRSVKLKIFSGTGNSKSVYLDFYLLGSLSVGFKVQGPCMVSNCNLTDVRSGAVFESTLFTISTFFIFPVSEVNREILGIYFTVFIISIYTDIYRNC